MFIYIIYIFIVYIWYIYILPHDYHIKSKEMEKKIIEIYIGRNSIHSVWERINWLYDNTITEGDFMRESISRIIFIIV